MDQEIWFFLVSVSLILHIQTNPNCQSNRIMMKRKNKKNKLADNSKWGRTDETCDECDFFSE